MNSFKLIPLILATLLLTYCSINKKADCENGNWQEQGFRDATQGYGKDKFTHRKEACLKQSFTTDEAFYWKGYEQGLQRFCNFKSGYEYGKKGKKYRDTCPLELESEFYKGYMEGQKAEKSED